MNDVWLIRSTFASRDEAVSIARVLLKNRRIACANINDSGTSLYHWEGSIQQEREIIAIFKTTRRHVVETITTIKSLHSYQIPSITAWPSEMTEPAFTAWVQSEVT